MPRSTSAGHRRTTTSALIAAAVTTAGLFAGVAFTSAGRAAPPVPRPVGSAGHHAGVRPTSGVTPAAVRAGLAAQARAKTAAVLDSSVNQLRPAGNGTVVVSVNGDEASVAAAATRLGGRVLVAYAGQSQVQLAKAQLNRLAQTRGVTAVSAPVKGHATASGPSQGVVASGANTWQSAGRTGDGVDVAVIDLGFGLTSAEYNNEKSNGHLGADTSILNEDCVNSGGSTTPYGTTSHGLATAEVVQQEAPGAVLHLYCVNSLAALATAEAAVQSAGIKIVTMSVEWTLDSRGDGSGPSSSGGQSAAITVAKARKAGILWVNSAGNDVPQHYGANFADANHDGVLDMGNHDPNTYPFESNFYYLSGTNSGANDADFALQWDEWPSGRASVSIQAYGAQCTTEFGAGGLDNCNAEWINAGPDGFPEPLSSTHTYGHVPTLDLDLGDNGVTNSSPYDQIWEILVLIGSGTPAYRYDLNAFGPFDGASDLSCPTADSQGNCNFSAAAVTRSVSAPGNSPYAFTVGAANVGADGTPQGTLEGFSSQGPTIDDRIKPDILGWDGVSSYVPEFTDGFYGTSAAAPNVAGAAALVAGAQPTWDASQIQNFLEQRAQHGTPNNPPTNAAGHGLLTLGAATSALPQSSRYTPVAPSHVLAARALGAGGTATFTVPGLPADAVAVAVYLTGYGATGNTNLAIYPGGAAASGTSNLNLGGVDSTAAVFAVATLSATDTLTVRNQAASVKVNVDLIGYFATGASGANGYTAVTPTRVLDTRQGVGAPKTPMKPGASLTVASGVPAGAQAVILNLTAANETGSGYLSTGSDCSSLVSTLNYTKLPRANLAVVALSSNNTFCLHNTTGTTAAVADVVGYLSPTGTGSYVTLPAPVRIVDTRKNNGQNAGNSSPKALNPGSTNPFTAGGIGDVPSSASALLTGVVEASASAAGYLALIPGATTQPVGTSTVNFTPGRVVPNAAIVALKPGAAPPSTQFSVVSAGATTHAIVDVFGYFVG